MVGIAIAAFALGVAVWGVWWPQREAKKQATLSLLREAATTIEPLRAYSPKTLQRQLIAFFEGPDEELADGPRDYLKFLTSFDLLAFAYCQRAVRRDMVDGYMSTIFQDPLLSRSFITEFRDCCRSSDVYKDLDWLLANQEKKNA